jgi:hypothetical protein
MRYVKRRKRCVISRERTRANDPESASVSGEPPVAVDAVCGVAGLLTLALRKNRAQTRYRVWFAAAVKFLIPFSLLVDVGSHWGRLAAPAITSPLLLYVIERASQPFSVRTPLATTTAAPDQPDPPRVGELLCGGSLEPMLFVYQRLG